MEGPKISVIVPVYKVEPYLRKCLDSIVNQTYRNLEIILIDDGSPDNCGAICDEYAAKDNRIQVIHKENGGLSSARNAALKIAAGDYIGFVDSDDWIEPKMFETLLCGLAQTQVDIAVCGRYEEYLNHSVTCCWPERQIMDQEEALGELLRNDKLQNLVWDKLYRRDLFNDLWFPEGRTFEDIAVMHWLFLRAKRIICLPEILYHYRQRQDSIVKDISLKNRMDHYQMTWERYQALYKDWPQFTNQMIAQCMASAIGLWTSYLSNPQEEQRRYHKQMQDIANFARLHRANISEHMNIGWAGRLILQLIPYNTWWAFSLARFIGVLYRCKHGQTL